MMTSAPLCGINWEFKGPDCSHSDSDQEKTPDTLFFKKVSGAVPTARLIQSVIVRRQLPRRHGVVV